MVEDNHNHFCIYCGAKLVPNQHFCSQCGKEVYHDPVQVIKNSSRYESKIKQLETEYKRVLEVVKTYVEHNPYTE